MNSLTRRDLLSLFPAGLLIEPKGTLPAVPPPSGFPRDAAFRRVTLEMSLKPFRKLDDAAIREVCANIFRQWAPLIRRVDSIAVMLWTADGSEILDYRGHLDDEIEWARYIGIGTPPAKPPQGDPERRGLHATPRLYMANPPRFTYRWLRKVVGTLKATGRELTGKPVEVGATFDPGPEFANSEFKYVRHPEISTGATMGAATWVACTATLHADTIAYAGYPHGIPEGTSIGSFLGRQSQHFLADLGFDYLWLSNGFGFSVSAWNVTGPLFDGKHFDAANAAKLRELVLSFWRDFRKECPQYRLETRGTNLLTGSDLASAASPLRDLYRGNFHMVAPPNSPWAALDGDFGLELAGYLSRIAELPPDEIFPFRYYTHDPWWLNSPWFDRYGREPHDIYLPLALARLNAKAEVTRPAYLEFLTIDDSYGRTPDQCPNEVTPHILTAMDHFSDEPGLVTWVYPFDEYHDLVFGPAPNPGLPFFGDWFIRSAINDGFPLNTVISTANYLKARDGKPTPLRRSILLTPVPAAGSPVEHSLLEDWKQGQDILFYGPLTHASETLRNLLGVKLAPPLEGILQIQTTLPPDKFRQGQLAATLHHRPLTSAGPIDTIGAHAEVTVSNQAGTRAYALFRPKQQGSGAMGWLRGTLSAGIANAKLPVSDPPTKLFPAATLLRRLLTRYGLEIDFQKPNPDARSPLLLAARSRNAYYLSGYSPSTSTTIKLRFPHGAPILTGYDTWLENGAASYTMPRAWHRELRCFVEQSSPAEITCAEVHSGHPGIRRRLVLRGLQDATVHFLPEPGAKPIFVANDMRPHIETSLPYEAAEEGRLLTARHQTGTLLISW